MDYVKIRCQKIGCLEHIAVEILQTINITGFLPSNKITPRLCNHCRSLFYTSMITKYGGEPKTRTHYIVDLQKFMLEHKQLEKPLTHMELTEFLEQHC